MSRFVVTDGVCGSRPCLLGSGGVCVRVVSIG